MLRIPQPYLPAKLQTPRFNHLLTHQRHPKLCRDKTEVLILIPALPWSSNSPLSSSTSVSHMVSPKNPESPVIPQQQPHPPTLASTQPISKARGLVKKPTRTQTLSELPIALSLHTCSHLPSPVASPGRTQQYRGTSWEGWGASGATRPSATSRLWPQPPCCSPLTPPSCLHCAHSIHGTP